MEVRIPWHAFVYAYVCKHISGQAYIQHILNATVALNLNRENLPPQSRIWGFYPFCFSTKTGSVISRASVSKEGARNNISNSACSGWSRCDLCHAQQTQHRNCLWWGDVSVLCSLAFAWMSSISFTGNHDGGVERRAEMKHTPLTHPLQLNPSRSW